MIFRLGVAVVASAQESKLDQQKFDQVMTTQQYIDQIKVNKDPFVAIYDEVQVPADSLELFNDLNEPLKLAVFTADWCGDAVTTTPVIMRLAESTPGLSIQIFNRDEELELTNSYLPENRAGTVPVFIVMDSSMNEIARFIETAGELVPALDAMDEAIAQEISGESEESKRAVGRGKRMSFRVAHAQEWGEVILDAFGRTVTEGLDSSAAQRPAVGGTKWPPED
mgnify:CR=1 FL=1